MNAQNLQLRQQWGRNVDTWRKVRGLTQEALAARCNVTQQSISAIIRGKTAPRDDLKVTISAALDVEVPTLFPLNRALAR